MGKKSLIGTRRVGFTVELEEDHRAALAAYGITTADALNDQAAGLFDQWMEELVNGHQHAAMRRELDEERARLQELDAEIKETSARVAEIEEALQEAEASEHLQTAPLSDEEAAEVWNSEYPGYDAAVPERPDDGTGEPMLDPDAVPLG